MRQVVGRDRDGDPIARDYLDVKAAKPAADAGEERVPLVALDAEVTARKGLHHATLDLNEIVSCHSIPFRRSRVDSCSIRDF